MLAMPSRRQAESLGPSSCSSTSVLVPQFALRALRGSRGTPGGSACALLNQSRSTYLYLNRKWKAMSLVSRGCPTVAALPKAATTRRSVKVASTADPAHANRQRIHNPGQASYGNVSFALGRRGLCKADRLPAGAVLRRTHISSK